MKKSLFLTPSYPDLNLIHLSKNTLSEKMPDYKNLIRWKIIILISLFFISFILIVTISCYSYQLINDWFYFLILICGFTLYFISLPILTKLYLKSDRVINKIIKYKKTFYYQQLTKIPYQSRLNLANNIWNALRSDKWRQCINKAQILDRKRTIYSCKQIATIATDLTKKERHIFSLALYKTIFNQRGSVLFFFDNIISLANQQHHIEFEKLKEKENLEHKFLNDFFENT